MKIRILNINGVEYPMNDRKDFGTIYSELVTVWKFQPEEAEKVTSILYCDYDLKRSKNGVKIVAKTFYRWFCVYDSPEEGYVAYADGAVAEAQGHNPDDFWIYDTEENRPPFPEAM